MTVTVTTDKLWTNTSHIYNYWSLVGMRIYSAYKILTILLRLVGNRDQEVGRNPNI